MIVRRCLATVLVVLALLGGLEVVAAERWSRQVSSSEWIPLASPRAASAQASQSNAAGGLVHGGAHLSGQVQTLALPPVLQQQYQEQLMQLQKTQESIQNLLLLQQQLKAQQQLLQSQAYLPNGYSNAGEDEKQTLPQSSLGGLQTAPELLVPSHPSSETLPPIYPPQDFVSERPAQFHQTSHQGQSLRGDQELSGLPVQGQVALQRGKGANAEDAQSDSHVYLTKQGGQRPIGKRLRDQSISELQQSSPIEGVGDEEEEVQLVYVPAETLAQRGQPKRGRGRKPYFARQPHQQRENQGNIEQTSLSPDQEAFARQVLHQIQKEHEEKAHFLKEERVKEFARLNEEQKALERKTRLQQEALQREQELLRQKEAEKKRKELERLEELAKQRELERIREAREKQRQEELERRRLAELRAKEEKRREDESRQREERQKQQLELEQVLKHQRILESQPEDQLRTGGPSLLHQNVQSQSLIQEQAHRQHLATDGSRSKKIRGRQRPQINQYQDQINYHEITTPSPNQPPLSVYMGSSTSKLGSIKVTDVLRILKDAKSIAVLDNVGPDSPQVFVGPSNLDPPYGYAKFDLPYLSSLDHNRVERKVDKLPFFVAPLSFDPPAGYSKIPFPAPHIGSVVVNTLAETSPEPDTSTGNQNSGSTPLIELNSYSDVGQSGSVATTTSYESPTTRKISAESSGPKYESSYSTPPSSSRFRFRQFYDNKPTSVGGASYYGEQSTARTKSKQYYEQDSKLTTQLPKVDTTVSYRHEVSYPDTSSSPGRTAGSTHDPSTKEQDLAAQLALINQELAQQREGQKYNTDERYYSQTNVGESYDANDVQAPVGPTRYNLPPELPPISPHLPGLVNSLLDKQEKNIASTPPSTTTPRTTTAPPPSTTTYRPRGRGRIVPTRPRTTQAPGGRTSTDRIRRPYNRSKSRFSTTTEDYHEATTYAPTKAKATTTETTQRYSTEYRRPTSSRTHKYRSRDRTSSQSMVPEHNQSVQGHQAAGYESDSQGSVSPDAYSPTSRPVSNLHQKETASPGADDFVGENYPPTTPAQTENYPPLREMTVQRETAPLLSNDYSRSQNYPPQNRPQNGLYQGAMYDQGSDFESPTLEKAPVNGFNYHVGNEDSSDRTTHSKLKYPRYQEKSENADYNLANVQDPRVRLDDEEPRYSPVYEVDLPQVQPHYNTSGQHPFRGAVDDKISGGAIETGPSAPPVFIPLQQNKQEEYELQIPSTEASFTEVTTTSTTTPAPVIIRQRVRSRLGGGGRPHHHDSAIQTRPQGPQDEYVRFSAVNHDSDRVSSQRHREGLRTRTRARPQTHRPQVQTDSNEYIKIHAVQQQRLTATTTPPTTTTAVAAVVPIDRPAEEDVDYGFIRPPSFRPVHSAYTTDSRYQAPITYRPVLSEIQHLIPNDETAVESSQTHALKNRLKYQQISNRRPVTKTFADLTTSTTTEAVSVATTIPDVYDDTTRPKVRPKESKPTRIRGRIRRPSKKRPTTTTTESVLEANNELPLDENYPRITAQQLSVTAAGQQQQQQQQQPLYDDNFDVSPQFSLNENRPSQFYEETGENYPTQEFILNFGNLPEQVSQREGYDQTQQASVPSGKYSHSLRMNPSRGDQPIGGDIYGAESQWSTKLSKTSFQPSFASNRVIDEQRKDGPGGSRDDRNGEDAPEIITAAPEAQSATVIVSFDHQERTDDAVNMDISMDTTVFGRKTNAQEHRLNVTTPVASSPPTTARSKTRDGSETSLEWISDKEEDSTEQTDKITKKFTESLRKGGSRRRRVRVRVRPAKEDFVTAESQHFNSAVNNLIEDRYKYEPIRESKFASDQPIATTIATTITTETTTQKSVLQGFLEEMLKNDEISIPTRVGAITTQLPDRTPITTPYVVSDDVDDRITTAKENYTPTFTTSASIDDEERIATTIVASIGLDDDSREAIAPVREYASNASQDEIQTQSETQSSEDEDSQEADTIQRENLEDVGPFTSRYRLPSTYPVGSGTARPDEENAAGLTELPTARQGEIRESITIEKEPLREKEHIMTLSWQSGKRVDEDEAYPKNHRTKWSEVKYPSRFDKARSTLRPSSTTSIPGVIARNEGDASVKTLSDYVKAIFDSMKSAEEEEEEEEEKMMKKVVEVKDDDTSANGFDDVVAPVRETSTRDNEETEERTTSAIDSSQDAFTTRQPVEVSSTTSLAWTQSASESATIFETTTMVPDTTTRTSFEDTVETTESPTTTFSVKTTTSVGRTTSGDVATNSTGMMLGKILRTSTTTKVSHMTEICYRGRCVMTKPMMGDDATR